MKFSKHLACVDAGHQICGKGAIQQTRKDGVECAYKNRGWSSIGALTLKAGCAGMPKQIAKYCLRTVFFLQQQLRIEGCKSQVLV